MFREKTEGFELQISQATYLTTLPTKYSPSFGFRFQHVQHSRFRLFPDLQILLEQDSNRGQRSLSCVPVPLRREPGGLQTLDGGGVGKNQGGEEEKGPGQQIFDSKL